MAVLLLFPLALLAQRPAIPKFGKVSPEDFKPASPLIDSGTALLYCMMWPVRILRGILAEILT